MSQYKPSSFCPYGFENCTETVCRTPCKKLEEYTNKHKIERQPNGNVTRYIRTKSKECADNNRTLVTLAHDGSISLIRMPKPMQSILLYPDQVAELFQLIKESNFQKTFANEEMKNAR